MCFVESITTTIIIRYDGLSKVWTRKQLYGGEKTITYETIGNILCCIRVPDCIIKDIHLYKVHQLDVNNARISKGIYYITKVVIVTDDIFR